MPLKWPLEQAVLEDGATWTGDTGATWTVNGTLLMDFPASPRRTLETAIQAAVGPGVTVYATPPETPAVPAIVIRPADPYQAPATAAGRYGAGWAFEVDIILGRWKADAALDALERAREIVTAALPDGWRWVEFGDIGETIINKKAYLRGTVAVATISSEGLTQYG